MTACVYVMLRADGLRKVGWAANVRSRRVALNSERKIRHEIEGVWTMGNAAAHWVETRVHRALKAQAVAREVYDLPLAEIAETIEICSNLCAVTLPDGLDAKKPEIPHPPKKIDFRALMADVAVWAEAHPDEMERQIKALWSNLK